MQFPIEYFMIHTHAYIYVYELNIQPEPWIELLIMPPLITGTSLEVSVGMAAESRAKPSKKRKKQGRDGNLTPRTWENSSNCSHESQTNRSHQGAASRYHASATDFWPCNWFRCLGFNKLWAVAVFECHFLPPTTKSWFWIVPDPHSIMSWKPLWHDACCCSSFLPVDLVRFKFFSFSPVFCYFSCTRVARSATGPLFRRDHVIRITPILLPQERLHSCRGWRKSEGQKEET